VRVVLSWVEVQQWDEENNMTYWFSAIPTVAAVACLAFCLCYFALEFWWGSGADLGNLDSLARRALFRAGALFVLALLILAFAPELGRLVSGKSTLARNGVTRVWANTKSGFYYCPGSRAYGKLRPGTFMTESDAVQSGYQPSLHQVCR
jgi:hypothetical protein